jgi:hypothetical protein
VTISAADPLYLHGIAGTAKRVPAASGQRIDYRDGVASAVDGLSGGQLLGGQFTHLTGGSRAEANK